MRKTVLTLALLISAMWAYAQSGFNYKILLSQGTNIMANQNVTLRLTLKDGGTSVYQETHSTTTDANGIASVTIGTGTVVSGSFSGIDWTHDISLQTEVSTNGGSSYTDFGTTPFEYVPYAKMSASAQKLEPTRTPVKVYRGSSLHTQATELKYDQISFHQYLDDDSGVDWYFWMGSGTHTLYLSHDGHALINFNQNTNLTRFYDDVQIDDNLQVKGKLKGDDSGDADMKAYIYGYVDVENTNVSILTNASSDGWSVSRISTGKYKVQFTNSPGGYDKYTVIASAYDSTSPQICTIAPATSYFYIYIWDKNGNAVDSDVYFVVYKK